ncbi:MAG: hypothetical protein KC416_12725 [Myxococcales bacterium]|nr:hypothetical protein [Myxococcales bacterium]
MDILKKLILMTALCMFGLVGCEDTEDPIDNGDATVGMDGSVDGGGKDDAGGEDAGGEDAGEELDAGGDAG